MNEYDSDKMADVLAAAQGMVLTENPEDADLILLNTCSVREKAQEKVFHQLGRFRPLKLKNPKLLIGVGGCVGSQEGEAIIKRTPYVDLVFGPQTLHRLPELLEQRLRSGKPQVDVSFPEHEKFDRLPDARVNGASALVSIMEGCSKYCTYCIVPYTRGEEISRAFDDVLVEAASLGEQGVKKITLLGQNVNAYRGTTHDGEIADLAMLLHYLAEISGIEQLAFTTSHPVEFSARLIQAYADIPKLSRLLHLPVQSGSDRILAAMKRGYTVFEYKSIIRRLRQARPDLSLASDFIVGFPGETEADFAATLDLVREMGFDSTSFAFIFSPRPGTPAADMADDVPGELKLERLQRLQQLLDAQTLAANALRVGTVQRVLVEALAKKNAGELLARTDDNRIVHFAGPARLIDRFVDIAITDAFPHSLRGEVVTVA